MKKNKFILLLPSILFTVCAAQKEAIIFRPDPSQDKLQEQTGSSESWEIIKSQNGSPEAGIPAWLRGYLDRGIQGIESLDAYSGKYVFVGENRGGNFKALQQWSDGFTTAQDLPRLIVKRVEKRLVTSAALYPDDEYGEYFAAMIKEISDGEYTHAHKEQVFWIQQRRIPASKEDAANSDTPPENDEIERYDFFVLVSVNKEVLQEMIRKTMADIKTNTAPTKEQRAAITKINQTFFEGF